MLGPGWAPVANAASVEAELARELGPTHVLRGRRLHASLDDFVRDYHEEW